MNSTITDRVPIDDQDLIEFVLITDRVPIINLDGPITDRDFFWGYFSPKKPR